MTAGVYISVKSRFCGASPVPPSNTARAQGVLAKIGALKRFNKVHDDIKLASSSCDCLYVIQSAVGCNQSLALFTNTIPELLAFRNGG